MPLAAKAVASGRVSRALADARIFCHSSLKAICSCPAVRKQAGVGQQLAERRFRRQGRVAMKPRSVEIHRLVVCIHLRVCG